MTLVEKRDLVATRDALTRWLHTKLPEAVDLEVANLGVPKASGFSNETVLFDASWKVGDLERSQRLVARLQAQGPGLFPVYDIGVQYKVMTTVGLHSDVPVPRTVWLEEDLGALGTPFFVMERVDGRVPADDPPYAKSGWLLDLPPEERARLHDNALEQLVKIHALNTDQLGLEYLARPEAGASPVEQEVAFYQSYYEWASKGRPHHLIDAAFSWLRTNLPRQAGPIGLSWGDARLGNMMFGDDVSVVAVLDWEMAGLARCEQDLGWWLVSDTIFTEGLGVPHPEGFPTRQAVIDRYEELSGHTVSDVSFFEVLAGLRIAVITLRLVHMMIDAGLAPPEEIAMGDNNPATRVLADLLGLDAPTGASLTSFTKAK